MSASPPAGRIELRLNDLNQLFNSLDPSPFFEKDIDADAEEFIVGWVDELGGDAPLELVLYLERPPGTDQSPRAMQEAVQNYFEHKAQHTRRQFSQLMRRGRVSLIIGLTFLAACLGASRFIESNAPATFIARESLIIVGWVAMWRPLEIFLYDWWPIRRQYRLYRRLSAVKVTLHVRGA